MPSAHRRYAEWTPDRFRRWAAKIGPSTEGLIVAVLANRPHPEQGFRTCLGILRLYRGIDPERAETVSARAVAIGALTYKSVASILAHKLDKSSTTSSSASSRPDFARAARAGAVKDGRRPPRRRAASLMQCSLTDNPAQHSFDFQ